MKIELLDILAVFVLVAIILLAYVLLSPTAIEQQVSALKIATEAGTDAVFYLNLSASGGYRAISLVIGDVHFSAPANWTYNIRNLVLTVTSSQNATDVLTVHVPSGAPVGSNATLSFLLYARSNPSVFTRSFSFTVISSTTPFVAEGGELLTVSVSGLNFVPWYAVIGPVALITLMVGLAVASVKR